MRRARVTHAGFTLPELIIVLGIFSTLISFSAVSFLRSQQSTSLSSQFDTLISDIRSQQFKAISSDSVASSNLTPYSIYFGEGEYVLFPGTTYIPGNEANYIVDISDTAQFKDVTIQNQTLTFLPVSGEMRNYSSSAHSFTLQSKTYNESKTISINPYGVVEKVE